MSTSSDSPIRRVDTAIRREATVVRVLALGAAALLLGGAVAGAPEAVSRPEPDPGVVRVESLPPYVVGPSVVLEASPAPHPATGEPVWIRVPDLDVSVPVVGIGLDGGGSLVPPSDPRVLGWWRDGAEPGALLGAAVVTGHTVSTGGGALDHLDTLERGSEVVVRTARGAVRYEVADVARYAKTTLADVSERVFAQDVPGRLVLVTCTGFDGVEYVANTVVVATPVE